MASAANMPEPVISAHFIPKNGRPSNASHADFLDMSSMVFFTIF
jgi:hypothetical protein